MPVYDLLQWLEANRKTGILNITWTETSKTFYFQDGEIIFVSSQKRGQRFGEFLVSAGHLTKEELRAALEGSAIEGICFTEYLLKNNVFSPDTLRDMLSRLAQQILIELFSSTQGSFSFYTPLPEIVKNGPVRLCTGHLIFESVRKVDELKRDNDRDTDTIGWLRETLSKEDFRLPPLPDTISRLQRIISDERSTFRDATKILMSDQIITTRILKIANSPFYAGAGKIDSLHAAIARIGMKELMNIVTAVKLKDMIVSPSQKERIQAVLDDAILTAFLSKNLAEQCGEDPEEAFLGGLLHDLGKTVILNLIGENIIDDDQLEKLLDENHADIGALIARKWHFPDSIQEMILYHHNYQEAGDTKKIVALIQFSDGIIFKGVDNGLDEEIMNYLNLNRDKVTSLCQETADAFKYLKNA